MRQPWMAKGFLLTWLLIAIVDLAPVTSLAAEPASQPEKSQYTLFNPTPVSLMREFVPDRPNVTEGPFTVDAGHFQVEMSFVEYTHDRSEGVSTDDFAVLPTDLRLGILNNVELGLNISPYENILVHGAGSSARNAGFGDTELRAKINLWGNDGGTSTALGLIPFVTLPTETDGLSEHHVEGGIIVPVDIPLPGDFDFGGEVEFDINYNGEQGDYALAIVHSVFLSHHLFNDKTSGYIEYVGVSPTKDSGTYLAYFDTGITYLLKENVQLDMGINIGLSEHAPDYTVLTGLTFRR